jgi:hypothetical protein
MDWFDLAEYARAVGTSRLARTGLVEKALGRSGSPPTSCSRCNNSSRSPNGLRAGGADASSCRCLAAGHDAFLVDIARFRAGRGDFLAAL